jgi:hypothetical protein
MEAHGNTNGKNAPRKAAATCKIFNAIRDDLQLRPLSAVFNVGGFNAALQDIPSAVELLDEQWTDLGAMPANEARRTRFGRAQS